MTFSMNHDPFHYKVNVGPTTHYHIIQYFLDLKEFIVKETNYSLNKIRLVIDNASVHSNKRVFDLLVVL